MNILTVIAAVGSGLMAGLFFAFSVAVMPGLRRMPAEQGMDAMRKINVAIVNPVFLLVFLGTTVASAVVVFTGHIVGGLLYVIGSFVITAVVNIPMNNKLEQGDVEYWPDYLTRWTRWNHVRALTSLAAATVLTLQAA